MILGRKIALRDIENEDYQRFHSWINDPLTNEMRGLYHPLSPTRSKDYLDQLFNEKNSLTFIIATQTEGAIGMVGLKNICHRSRRAELWIYIGDRKQWNKGLGSDSIRTLCQYAFEQMNLHRIWLETDVQNLGAIKCYERIGFVKEGTLRDGYYRHGRYRDTSIYGLLRGDFPHEHEI